MPLGLTEIIAGGLLSIVGTLLITQVWQHNWFKKESFKHKLSQAKKVDTLNYKKLERQLGLPHTKAETEPTGNILDKIKGLDMDKINMILDALGTSEEDREESPVNTLINMVTENPEIVSKFLGGLKEKNTSNTGETYL